MARIKDVAKLAGVSTSTVSLVLNNKGYVSAATRAKVEAAVKELHYVPSEVGRNLSLNRTNLIGVIIPDVAHPFFAALLHEIEIALYDYGYKTMICSTGEKKNAELAFLEIRFFPRGGKFRVAQLHEDAGLHDALQIVARQGIAVSLDHDGVVVVQFLQQLFRAGGVAGVLRVEHRLAPRPHHVHVAEKLFVRARG